MGVEKAPEWYVEWRPTLDIDTVEYGAGGLQLFRSDEVPRGQVGFAVASDGESLVGVGPGDWRPEWLVIGLETACGDPIFASEETPHSVFTAIHGEGTWEPKTVAPSILVFSQCVKALHGFAVDRGSLAELDANPPTRKQQAQFLGVIRSLTNGNPDALNFWAVQIEVDLGAFDWSA